MKPSSKERLKERLLSAINTVVHLEDYRGSDCIYSQKYHFFPVAMAYILKRLAADFQFTITDDFVDALEMCTFERLEALLEQYENTAVPAA